MNLGTRTIEVPVSEGNLHAELETVFRRWGYLRDGEDLAALHIDGLRLGDGASTIHMVGLEVKSLETEEEVT